MYLLSNDTCERVWELQGTPKIHSTFVAIQLWDLLISAHRVFNTVTQHSTFYGLPCGSAGKESVCNAGDPGSIPVLGRSPGEGNENPLKHTSLENPMDRRAWQATVHGITKIRRWLSNFASLSLYILHQEQTRFISTILL